eukprot:1271120-Prymnesium_polylepis.1
MWRDAVRVAAVPHVVEVHEIARAQPVRARVAIALLTALVVGCPTWEQAAGGRQRAGGGLGRRRSAKAVAQGLGRGQGRRRVWAGVQ